MVVKVVQVQVVVQDIMVVLGEDQLQVQVTEMVVEDHLTTVTHK